MSGRSGAVDPDVVETRREAAGLGRDPLIVLETLREYLDARGLGDGPLRVAPIGDGHSNVTFLLERGAARFVLRRPPRGPLPPRAHDVLREARLLRALGAAGLPVPAVLASCEDEAILGSPFFVMSHVDALVLADSLPRRYDPRGDPGKIATALVERLAEIHDTDLVAAGLSELGRSDGYLRRQLRLFGGQLDAVARRPLPALHRVGEWLAANLPESSANTLVHGDYRLGNVMFDRRSPRILAVLDWEMATLGDPLADLGYCTAMWAQHGDPPNPMFDLCPVTRIAGFPSRAELAERYAGITGRSLEALPWYQVLATWKAAIFLEASYGRYRDGTTDDPYFAGLEEGVPALGARAEELIAGGAPG